MTKETSDELTNSTANSYVASLKAVEVLSRALLDVADEGHDIRDEESARRIRAAIRDEVRDSAFAHRHEVNAYQLLEETDLAAISEHPGGLVGTWIDQQLEVIVLFRQSIGHDDTPQISGVEVLLGYGGPNVRLNVETNDPSAATLQVWWGGDHASRPVYLPEIGNQLIELAESTYDYATQPEYRRF